MINIIAKQLLEVKEPKKGIARFFFITETNANYLRCVDNKGNIWTKFNIKI